ncbi:MAG TPA: ribosome maturation factor RimM [Polyangiaceae bacterium]|nr:ribosome maturation factor RimM [Polyangiaceae bacterium]
MTQPLLDVGWVLKAHGLKGELCVRLHWPDSTSLEHAKALQLSKGQRTQVFQIVATRKVPEAVLVTLQGVSDRNTAELWRGAQVCVDRAELPGLEPDEYYLADLVGAKVSAPDGEVGVVVELVFYPSVECLVIETPSGQRVEQPILEQWLEHIDAKQRTVRLNSREGLIAQE